MTLIPKHGHVLVKPFTPKPPDSPIALVEYAEPPETSGLVIALAARFTCPDCGAGQEPGCQVGDVVVFPPTAGNEVELDDERYLMIPAAAILALVSEGV